MVHDYQCVFLGTMINYRHKACKDACWKIGAKTDYV